MDGSLCIENLVDDSYESAEMSQTTFAKLVDDTVAAKLASAEHDYDT